MASRQRHELRLQVRVDEIRSITTPQVVPWVDGSVLALDLDTRGDSADSGLGMDPDRLLGRHSPLLPPAVGDEPIGEPPRLATVWRCSCGDTGCGSIRLRVYRENTGHGEHDTVVWDDWHMRFGSQPAPGPLRFDTREYYSELIRAYTDRWWEDAPHRVARELAGTLEAHPGILGRWGCALVFTRGFLRDGRGHVDVELRSATTRHFLDLACDPDADTSEEAQRLTALLTHTDPGELPAHFRSPTL